MPFKPGQSGNPKGRPHTPKSKRSEAQAAPPSEVIPEEEIKVISGDLLRIAQAGPPTDGTSDSTWRFAVKTVLEYALGKPTSTQQAAANLEASAEAITGEQNLQQMFGLADVGKEHHQPSDHTNRLEPEAPAEPNEPPDIDDIDRP